MNHRSGSPEQPSCVLLCGKTELLDYETLKQIAQYYNVIVTGEGLGNDILKRKKSRKIHIYREDPTSDNFAKIIYSYSPDAVWYFSGYIDGGDGLDNESKKIESLIHGCVVNEISKLVVISSINALNYRAVDEKGFLKNRQYADSRSFNCSKMEEQVSFLSRNNNIKCITVRVPFISNSNNNGNYLGSLFAHMSEGTSIDFPYNEKQMIDFLSARDLGEMLISVTEETMDTTAEYTALSGFDHTYSELHECIKKSALNVAVTYDPSSVYELVLNKKKEAQRMRENYGFIPADDVLGTFDLKYDDYVKNTGRRSPVREKLKELLSKLSDKMFKAAELIILFAITQYILRYTADSVYFKYVDIRLFFVVLMGMTHGMTIGIAAGILECFSLIFAYRQTGVTGTMLFYNVDYWLPFAIYLMTGAITGYIMSTKNHKLAFAEEETYALQDKYMFLNNVYMSVIDNKEEYKRQILGYQDSFGKIFDAVERLNSSVPADIFMNGINTLERILNNHSIAIYTMDDWQKYLRLVSCSREMMNRLTNSVNIDDFREVYGVILSGETWKNNEFKEDLPMYAYAIVEDGKVRLMICLFQAGTEQMGLYYMNLFTILCNLIRVSFMRALEYQEAIEDEKFYPGTEVMLKEYFVPELETYRKMADAGVASYVLLRMKTEDVNELNEQLKGHIRHSDMAGTGEDGHNYLILTQTTGKIFGIIGKRFDDCGIEYSIVEGA